MASEMLMSHMECTRARGRSVRGRPQRCVQGQLREATRTPSARFGSRGSSVGSRSRSRRPSSEIELRGDAGLQAASPGDGTPDRTCATGFICDLLDDAVDDFADDLIQDEEDVFVSAPASFVTPVKAISGFPIREAQLVLNAGEPAITEEVEEDEDICAAALIFTARSVEGAISAVVPNSPTWSRQAAPTELSGSMDLDAASNSSGEEEADDCSLASDVCCGSDGYEEVYSLASDISDAEESDDEIESMAYVQMAVSLAKAAVAKGVDKLRDEVEVSSMPEQQVLYAPRLQAAHFSGWSKVDIAEKVNPDFNAWFFNEEAMPMLQQRPAYVPRIQNKHFNGWSQVDIVKKDSDSSPTPAEHTSYAPRLQNKYVTGWSKVDIPKKDVASVDIDEAKEAARDALCLALLGRTSQCDNEVQEADVEENSVEFLGEKLGSEELAFDYASDILDGAFVQAAATWEHQQDEADEVEALRQQARATLSKAVNTGELEAALRHCRGASVKPAKQDDVDLELLKAKARETLIKAAAQREQSQNTAAMEVLRQKARSALVQAASAGQLVPSLKAATEKKQMNDLKEKLRNTLCKATRDGRLTSTLCTVAPKSVDIETARLKAREALAKATSNGKFESALEDVMQRRQAAEEAAKAKEEELDLRQKVLSTLKQAMANGQIDAAIKHVMAKREEKKERPVAETVPSSLPASSPQAKSRDISTPTRSHRRIIGGVVRTPAMQLDIDMPSVSPNATPWSDSTKKRKSRKTSKEAPRAFRLDIDDKSDVEETNRGSSLTRGYDTLGAQFHNICDSPSASSAPKLMLQQSNLCRPSSKASARLRAASSSAMAMDLGFGDGFTSASSSRVQAPSADDLLAAFQQSFMPKALSLEQKLHPSASWGSLPASKMSKVPGRLLPTLASEKKSAESIAWTMHMSKSTSKWCNTGLHGSASAVF